MKLLESVQNFIKTKRTTTEKDLLDSFKRANIVPTGQIQYRSTIVAADKVGTQVHRPENEQRAKNLISELGIKYLENLSANLDYPVVGGNTSQWVAETEIGNVENTAYESITLSPRRMLSYVELGKEIILNPYTDVQGSVEDDILESVYSLVQETMFNEIYDNFAEGEDNTIYSLSDYDDIISLELQGSLNKINNPVYLVSPTAASKLKAMNTTIFPVVVDGKINGFPMIETPFLEDEKVIFGDFSKLILGNFGGLDITVNNFTKIHQGIISLVLNSYWDFKVLDPAGFLFATTGSSENNEEPTPDPEPGE